MYVCLQWVVWVVAAYMATLHYDITRSLGNVFVPSALLGATVFVVSV